MLPEKAGVSPKECILGTQDFPAKTRRFIEIGYQFAKLMWVGYTLNDT